MEVRRREDDHIVARTRAWIQSFIVGLDICPFASSVLDNILYDVLHEVDPMPMINQIVEMATMIHQPGTIKTAFLITPDIDMSFSDFYALSQILQDAVNHRYPEQYVLIAFHPDFRYEGTEIDHTSNAVNRSPFPMIHVLSSQSLNDVTTDKDMGAAIAHANQVKLASMDWSVLHEKYGVPLNQER